MAKNELVKAENFNLLTISGDLADAVAEEMDGLGSLSFDRVKIPAGGSISFELPGEDEDSPESTPALVGVILDHHAVNAWWRDIFSGGNAQPDCSSIDGKRGIVRSTGEIRDCASCPYNQFGSDGRGKACKNMHRLYILREGNPVPIILALHAQEGAERGRYHIQPRRFCLPGRARTGTAAAGRGDARDGKGNAAAGRHCR